MFQRLSPISKFILFVSVFFSTPGEANDAMLGTWEGISYSSWGEYNFCRLNLDSSHNATYHGTLYVRVRNELATAHRLSRVQLIKSDSVFHLKSLEIIEERIAKGIYVWCLEEAVLSLTSHDTCCELQGLWRATECYHENARRLPRGKFTFRKSASGHQACPLPPSYLTNDYQRGVRCTEDKLQEWRLPMQGETPTEHAARTNESNENAQYRFALNDCLCNDLNWTDGNPQYAIESEQYTLNFPSYTPIVFNVPAEERESFECGARFILFRNVKCHLDHNLQKIVITYAEVFDFQSGKVYKMNSP